MTWNIVSDSSCDLLAGDITSGAASFEVVPMRLQVGEREFVDDAALDVPELLVAMAGKRLPRLRPAPLRGPLPAALKSVTAPFASPWRGCCPARIMPPSWGGRWCWRSIRRKICVIDSKATAGALVLLVRRAKALIEADPERDFEELCGELRMYQASLRTCFTLENFDNLIKSGRMRPLVGTLLHSLGIHVIADATPQGTIHVADKARGEVKTFKAMTALMEASKDCSGAEVVISHCENPVGAVRLKEQILANLPVKSVDILTCRGLTSFYAMEKGLIVGY